MITYNKDKTIRYYKTNNYSIINFAIKYYDLSKITMYTQQYIYTFDRIEFSQII